MFLVTSTYLKSREEMESLLPLHAEWLKTQHEEGIFLASGSVVPRSGGAIMAHALSREKLEALLASSPLAQAGAVHYKIEESSPMSKDPS